MEIMAATANNHNQKELRLYAPNEQHQQQQQQAVNTTSLLAGGARSPFQREVREWQRIDPETGALLTGRLEADRWINGPLNKYGKISDSQNIAQPNGTQQTHRKQLEVLQTCTATGGAMQVIRSQTVQTTSSRWSTSSASPLLLSASTSPIPQAQLQPQTLKNNKHNFRQKTHTNHAIVNTTKNNIKTSNTPFLSTTPFIAPQLLTNGFNHKQQHHQLNQQLPQQYPHCVVNGISSRRGNRNWPDLTKNMSTLDICDNDHDNEHDHDSNYIVQQQSSDDEPATDDNDNNGNNYNEDLLIENNDDDDNGHYHHYQYSLNERNNLKNLNGNKRHSFTVFANNNDNNISSTIQANNHYEPTYNYNDHDHDSYLNHQANNSNNNHHNNNLSRDSSSGSCNNQLFLLDTAPSLKLSNLMKSSSSLSNSSNNSTTASQATTTATTNPTSMNTHKNLTTNKISLHAIVGNNNYNNNNNNNNTTTSSTPSPTFSPRSSWQQPSLYRQNSHNNNSNKKTTNHNNDHLMKSRVGDTNNCCSSSSSDESRSYAGKSETDLRHLQRRQSPNQQLQQQPNRFKQNDRLTPTHSPQTTYNRVDLESFRHYNNNNNNDKITTNDINDTADDDGLRLSSRHLRRQQIPHDTQINSLQRCHSISTDDLSTEWDIQGAEGEEPAEWRRVSKLRRSFQSTTKNNHINNSPTTNRRPLDLPSNSVSVSKIRAELENGRRLNTVMRNNHVDLAALSSILNGNDKETKSPLTSKRDSFLTAESLKEIRGKLKKLSDESLYKEDFVINQINNDSHPIVEHIANDEIKLKAYDDKSPERYRVTSKPEELNSKHTTNSLESRIKYRDTNSIDWHLRRKSYGFEKMSPPEKAMLRMDASTDSGLGRSGELQNLSPLTTEANANNRTVVHFGDTAKVSAKPSVQRRYRPQKSHEEPEISPEEDMSVSKRHSIAVDESQYVRDNSRQTTQIHLNGFYEPSNFTKLIHSTETGNNAERGQQKRVEFSKTEVHFATESGRVNIVETDSKPPPTNNFRRRKSRSSSVGPLQSLVKSATTVSTSSTVSTPSTSVVMPVTLFGNDSAKNKTIASTTVAYRAPLVGSPEPKEQGINVTVTIPSHADTFAYAESSRSSYASTSGVDTTDCDTDEMTSLRGILKNKPAKPKPYVLGENIDKPDDLWGVQLKPVVTQAKMERVFKSESPPLLNALPQKSVAERIQELGSSALSYTNSFSTKINVNLGNDTSVNNKWEETGLTTTTDMKRKPSLQELLMHDLKEHQKILDEGLKSTTLIMKTMRSANEFDEAMRRLSLASVEAAVVKPTAMFRSNSYQDSGQTVDYVQPYNGDINNLYKSISFCSTSSWSSNATTREYSQDSRKTSTDSGASFTNKDFMPRLSFLANDQLPANQQLQRLRLIYDAAISQEEDSADEEVKRYFKEQNESDSGGGTQDSSSYEDDQSLEPSSSWNRLKATKTIWNIETDKSVERRLRKALDKTELPKSNVMSIKLHSPQTGNEVEPPVKVVPPIVKPRTVTTIQETPIPNLHTASAVKQTSAPNQTSLPTKDSLKIIKEARGARQLRDHEFSYFGVAASTSEDEKPQSKYKTNSTNFRNSPKRSLPLRKLKEETSTPLEAQHAEQWQFENHKPDLLKHNAIVIKPAERLSLKQKAELDEDEEHLYENIANDITPMFKVKTSFPNDHYDRKMDLKRDAMILSEMNKNADQTLKELSDEAALKDRRRRSLQRHNSKPLETIDEKSIAERINDTCIAVKISRGTYASEARKSSRHSTPSPANTHGNSRERTSSQSSIECCPRARSRSLSSEKEYDTTKSKPSRTTQMVKHKQHKQTKSRSSSLDSQRSANSQCSSSEEQKRVRNTASFRREDRSRTKTKRITSSASFNTRDNKHRDDKAARLTSQTQQQCKHQGDLKQLSSTTRSSSLKERVECKHDNASATKTSQQPRHHNSSNTGLQRSTNVSGSGRHNRDDLRDSQRIKRSSTTASGRSTKERVDKNEALSGTRMARSVRNDERNSSQRSSSNRLEHGDKDKERSSRSTKGHSSRSTSQQSHERINHPGNKSSKTKTANNENTTSSKNVLDHHHHHHHHHPLTTKERHEQQLHKTKRDEDHTEHVHGLKSAIIKTTTKQRDKSRNRKENK